jgi:hypothetical protein
MAVEGASFRRAWQHARACMVANRETFLSYFILRMTMLLIAGTILGFLAWVAGLIVFSVLGMSAAGFNAMLDGTSDFRAYLLVGARLLFILLGFGAGAAIAVSFGGPICVFLRCYALFYYGGHYKALGNLLSPAMPVSDAVERVAEIS